MSFLRDQVQREAKGEVVELDGHQSGQDLPFAVLGARRTIDRRDDARALGAGDEGE